MELIVNKNKTKYMFITRNPTIMQNLKVEHYLLKHVENLKYLRVNINQSNKMHNEISVRLVSVNREYHIMKSILSSRLSREIKTKLYIAYLRFFVMCTRPGQQ